MAFSSRSPADSSGLSSFSSGRFIGWVFFLLRASANQSSSVDSSLFGWVLGACGLEVFGGGEGAALCSVSLEACPAGLWGFPALCEGEGGGFRLSVAPAASFCSLTSSPSSCLRPSQSEAAARLGRAEVEVEGLGLLSGEWELTSSVENLEDHRQKILIYSSFRSWTLHLRIRIWTFYWSSRFFFPP